MSAIPPALLPFGISTKAINLRGRMPLEWPEEDLSTRLMDGAHRFVEQQIAAAGANRSRYWKLDRASGPGREAVFQENRERLREIIGAVEPRLPPRMERFGDDSCPALADRTEIEFFQGGHSINGQDTFAFLHKHLNWPLPEHGK